MKEALNKLQNLVKKGHFSAEELDTKIYLFDKETEFVLKDRD